MEGKGGGFEYGEAKTGLKPLGCPVHDQRRKKKKRAKEGKKRKGIIETAALTKGPNKGGKTRCKKKN